MCTLTRWRLRWLRKRQRESATSRPVKQGSALLGFLRCGKVNLAGSFFVRGGGLPVHGKTIIQKQEEP